MSSAQASASSCCVARVSRSFESTALEVRSVEGENTVSLGFLRELAQTAERMGGERKTRLTTLARSISIGRVGAEDDVLERLSAGKSGEKGAEKGEAGTA